MDRALSRPEQGQSRKSFATGKPVHPKGRLCSGVNVEVASVEVLVVVALWPRIGDASFVSDPRDARPGAPAAPRPPNTPKAPAVTPARPQIASAAQTPRPPLVQASRAPAPHTPQKVTRAAKSTPPPPPVEVDAESPDSGWEALTVDTSATDPPPRAVAPVAAKTMVGTAPAPSPVASRVGSSPDTSTGARRPASAPDLAVARPMTTTTATATTVRGASSVAAVSLPSPPEAGGHSHVSARVTTEIDEAAEARIFEIVSAALGESLLPLLDKQKELEARLDALRRAAEASTRVPIDNESVARAPSPGHPTRSAAAESVASGPRTAVIPTTYGYLTATEGQSRRPSIELALENVGPIEVPDFGRGRRAVGTVLVGLLLAGVVAAIAATILSYA